MFTHYFEFQSVGKPTASVLREALRQQAWSGGRLLPRVHFNASWPRIKEPPHRDDATVPIETCYEASARPNDGQNSLASEKASFPCHLIGSLFTAVQAAGHGFTGNGRFRLDVV